MNDPYARYLHRTLARRRVLALFGAAGAATVLAACSSSGDSKPGSAPGSTSDDSVEPSDPNVTRPSGWSDDSHGNGAEPDYGVVFPTDRVNQVAITITAERWQSMLDDMTGLFGARGTGGGPGGGRMPGGAPQGGQPPVGQAPGGIQPGGQGGPPGDFTAENPMWVPATVAFNGRTWTNVGVRFKGNSSLANSWRSGTDKMPLKLDFDEFEGDYPEIANQRFYGFKQFSLSNNFSDSTFMRESVAYSLLEQAGLVAAKTAPWLITLDKGEGPKTLGIYTAIEVIDDTVIDRVFEDGSGNIYEGDGRGASLAAGTSDALIESSFQVEGGDNADWADIKALYAALHDSSRTANAGAWRSKLESLFEVDSFLEWLALAAALGHWDTYGGMTHNFYLYNNPADKKLHWISWDHNEVLGNRMGGNAPAGNAPVGNQPGGGLAGRANVSFDKAEVNASWPLIRHLLDQPTYLAKYNEALRDTVSLFDISKLSADYQRRAAVLRAHVGTDSSESAFNAAVDGLIAATQARADALGAYVDAL